MGDFKHGDMKSGIFHKPAVIANQIHNRPIHEIADEPMTFSASSAA